MKNVSRTDSIASAMDSDDRSQDRCSLALLRREDSVNRSLAFGMSSLFTEFMNPIAGYFHLSEAFLVARSARRFGRPTH